MRMAERQRQFSRRPRHHRIKAAALITRCHPMKHARYGLIMPMWMALRVGRKRLPSIRCRIEIAFNRLRQSTLIGSRLALAPFLMS
jgi:hypothetical protein